MSISPQGGLISPSDNAEEKMSQFSHSGIVWTWLDPVCWTARFSSEMIEAMNISMAISGSDSLEVPIPYMFGLILFQA